MSDKVKRNIKELLKQDELKMNTYEKANQSIKKC